MKQNKTDNEMERLQVDKDLLLKILKADYMGNSTRHALRIAYLKHEGMLSNKFLIENNYSPSTASFAIKELKKLGLIAPYLDDSGYFVIDGFLPLILKSQLNG